MVVLMDGDPCGGQRAQGVGIPPCNQQYSSLWCWLFLTLLGHWHLRQGGAAPLQIFTVRITGGWPSAVSFYSASPGSLMLSLIWELLI